MSPVSALTTGHCARQLVPSWPLTAGFCIGVLRSRARTFLWELACAPGLLVCFFAGDGRVVVERSRPRSSWCVLRLFVESRFSGSLYALLTRFRALTTPRVRFAPVWPSTGRTVSERGMWRLYVAVAMPPRGVSTFLCWRAKERPWPCGRGALFVAACAVRVTC